MIGAGVIGLCVALYLARQGAGVILADRSSPGAGASSGNAGLVVPSYVVPLASVASVVEGLRSFVSVDAPIRVRFRRDRRLGRWWLRFFQSCAPRTIAASTAALHAFATESLALHRELATEMGGYGFQQKGWLHLYRRRGAFETAIRAASKTSAAGIRSDVLPTSEARRMAQARSGDLAGGIYYPDDAQLNPELFMRELVRAATGSGVRLLASRQITLRRRGPEGVDVVDSRTGEAFRCEACVLAAGSSSVAVGRSIRLDIPIEAAMGYSITVRTENNIPLPLMLAESHVVMTPMGDAVRLTSGLDLVGEDRKIDATRIRSMETAARTYLGLDLGAGTEPWVGFRPLTPDSLPIAGRSTRFSNLFMATGHGTLGVTLAPATGNLVAAILSGRPVPAWTNAVSPARFGI